MKVIGNDNKQEQTELVVTYEEYAVILSSLIEMYINEHWIEEWEMPARIGCTRDDIKDFIKQMGAIIEISPEVAEEIISPRHMEFIEKLKKCKYPNSSQLY